LYFVYFYEQINDRLIDWLIDWSIDSLIDRFIDRFFNSLVHWLVRLRGGEPDEGSADDQREWRGDDGPMADWVQSSASSDLGLGATTGGGGRRRSELGGHGHGPAGRPGAVQHRQQLLLDRRRRVHRAPVPHHARETPGKVQQPVAVVSRLSSLRSFDAVGWD